MPERRVVTFFVGVMLLGAELGLLVAHAPLAAAASNDYVCNATTLGESSSFGNSPSLFARELDDANCTSAFDCFVEFCSCVDGTLSSTCAPFQANATTVEGCAAKRANCILASGLAEYNSTNSTCRTWSLMVEDAYYGHYLAANRADSFLTRACLDDSCSLLSDGNASVASAVNFSFVCAFENVALTVPRNLTTPAPVPIALPDNATTSGNNTGVRFQLTGSQWSKTLRNNRTSLTTLVQTTVANAVNTTASDVEVVSMVEGSLIVTFRISSRSQDAASNTALATLLRDNINITDLGSFYQATADVVEVLALAGVSVVVLNDAPSSVPCDKWCFVAATAGGFGGLALVGVVVVACILYCCHANTTSHPAVDDDEAVPSAAEGAQGNEPTAGAAAWPVGAGAAATVHHPHRVAYQPTSDAANGRVIMDRSAAAGTAAAQQGVGGGPAAGGAASSGLNVGGGSGWWTTLSSESVDEIPFQTQQHRRQQNASRRT